MECKNAKVNQFVAESAALLQPDNIVWIDGSEEQIDLCPGCKSGNIRAHNGIYSIIKDWRSNQTMTFLSMVRGGKASGSV